MNIVTLTGRMANEAVVSTTQNGARKVEGRIGVRKPKKGGEAETMWINFIAWEYTADKISAYVHKGDMFEIVGHLEVSSYTDRNGEQRKKWQVVVDAIPQLLPNADKKAKAEVEYEDKPKDTVANIVKKDMKSRMEDLDHWSTPVFEDAGDLPF